MMKKVPFNNVAPILKQFELSPEALQLVTPDLSVTESIERLTKAELFVDLVNFWAHALPMREAIWWSYLSAAKRQNTWSQPEKVIAENVNAWLRAPSEPLRRQIESAVDSLPNESAVRWLGLAVFWSGTGSIAPMDSPAVMPAEMLYAKAVAGAVNIAAALPEWDGFKGYYSAIFQSALAIANGGNGQV